MKRAEAGIARSSKLAMLLALVCAGAGAAVWSVLRAPRERTALVGTTASVHEEDAGAPRTSAALESAARAEPEPEPAAPVRSQSRTSAAAEEAELADAIWIEGRVLFPAGTPADERAEVVALGRSFDALGYHRAEVGRDGSFRVAFHAGTKVATLGLEGRYCYLERSDTIELREPPADVVLEPRLGALVEGVLLLPEVLRPGEAGPTTVSVSLAGEARRASSRAAGRVDGQSDGSISCVAERVARGYAFELGGVPADAAYMLSAVPEGWRKLREKLAPFAPGERRTLELRLTLGARLAGRVVDEAGQGVAKAGLNASTSMRTSGTRWSSSEPGMSDGTGAFVFGGVAPGNVTLTAQQAGYTSVSLELGDLAEGDVRADLELVLARGHSVAGRVLWPDGSPAAGAHVSVEQPPDGRGTRLFSFSGEMHGTARAAPDGAFEISGLGSGPYRVVAGAEHEEDGTGRAQDEEGSSPEADARRRALEGAPRAERWIAQADGVPADAAGLVLVLGAGAAVRGRVVDERGVPVEEFTIELRRATQALGYQPARMPGAFHDANGAFEVGGLGPGDWVVTAEAPGHAQSHEVRVALPRDSEPLELVVVTGATVAGTVLGQDGKPAAEVRVSAMQRHRTQPFVWNRDGETRTRADGTFTLAGVSPGTVQIDAAKDGFAGGEPFELELRPGERREGIVLALVRGGRIEGEVLAQGAASPAGRGVVLRPAGGEVSPGRSRKWQSTDSDAEGRFAFDAVPPGRYRVELADTGGIDVDVEDGRTVRVVLGRPPEGAIRVFGHVTRGGTGLAGAMVMAGGQSRFARTETDASGRYELFVDRPGEYSFSVFQQGKDGFGGGFHRQEQIAAGAEQCVDFELSTGRIRGRVLAPDGSGLGGVSVSAGGQGAFGHATSGADGGFEIGGLSGGVMRVLAQMHAFTGSPPYAPASRDVELADGATLDGVELRLGEAGEIEGRVLTGAGQPIAGVAVLVSDAESQLPAGTTDGAGRFKVGGIGNGPCSIWARKGLQVSETRTVDVRAGGTVQVDLTVSPGTLVQVVVENPPGWFMAWMTDARQVAHSWYDINDPELRALGGKMPPGGRRIGPLPPGEYTLVVRDRDGGRGSEQTVALKGEPFREIKVKLE